jgi:hypothetical protein
MKRIREHAPARGTAIATGAAVAAAATPGPRASESANTARAAHSAERPVVIQGVLGKRHRPTDHVQGATLANST